MSMTIADHLRAYSQAYPIDIFPKCDENLLKSLHKLMPNMAARIYAESGRNFARQALEGADELDRMEGLIDKLLAYVKEVRQDLVDGREEFHTTIAIKNVDKLIAECEQ